MGQLVGALVRAAGLRSRHGLPTLPSCPFIRAVRSCRYEQTATPCFALIGPPTISATLPRRFARQTDLVRSAAHDHTMSSRTKSGVILVQVAGSAVDRSSVSPGFSPSSSSGSGCATLSVLTGGPQGDRASRSGMSSHNSDAGWGGMRS